MTISRRTALRVLDNAEVELVERSRHPDLGDLSNEELRKLRRHLRERRDRAQDIAHRVRREMRGKASRTDDRAPTEDRGIRERAAILASAVQRANQEHSRRERFEARDELKKNAEKALELRKSARRHNRPASRRSDKGMRSIPNEKAEDLVNRMEVGRVSQFVKDSQARKDNR